eukprot:gene5287-944_t
MLIGLQPPSVEYARSLDRDDFGYGIDAVVGLCSAAASSPCICARLHSGNVAKAVVAHAGSGSNERCQQNGASFKPSCAPEYTLGWTELKRKKKNAGGNWTELTQNCRFVGVDLRGKTLGIIGMGRSLSMRFAFLIQLRKTTSCTLIQTPDLAVANSPFEERGNFTIRYLVDAVLSHRQGMHVQYYDVSKPPTEAEDHLSTRVGTLHTLLASSDVLSLHTNLTADSMALIGSAEFDCMKPGVIFINTARGQVVDQDAMLESLANGKVGMAGLDVFPDEPDVHPKLRLMDNVVLTPHLGSATLQTRASMMMRAFVNIFHSLKGLPWDLVNKPCGMQQQSPSSLSVAELIVQDAHSRGLRHIFGIPGSGAPMDIMKAADALGIKFVATAHESTAAIAAAYYGNQLATAGLCLAIKGVGAGNLVGGMVNAHTERMPVVCLVECRATNVPSHLQFCQHIGPHSLMCPFSKYSGTMHQSRARTMLDSAVLAACSGRPGVALLDLPGDVSSAAVSEQQSTVDMHTECNTLSASHNSLEPSESEVLRCASLLRSNGHIVVLAGADVVSEGNDCVTALRNFVDTVECAVMSGMNARGVYPESLSRWGVLQFSLLTALNSPVRAIPGSYHSTVGYILRYSSTVIEAKIFQHAKCILALGMDAMMQEGPGDKCLPMVELQPCRSYPALEITTAETIRGYGSLKIWLERLTAALTTNPPAPYPAKLIVDGRQEILETGFQRPNAQFTANDIIQSVHQALQPDNGVLFSETGIFVCMLEHIFPVANPRSFFGTTGGRTMGLTLPALLGSKLAAPHKRMIGIGGDGSLLMRLGELE